MGSSPPKTTSEAPEYVQPHLEKQATAAGGIYDKISANGSDNDNVYQGDRVAAFNPNQTAAMASISGQNADYQNLQKQAAGIGDTLNQQGMTQGGADASDFYRTQMGGNNDAFKSMLDAESRNMRDQINLQAGGAGRYGSGAHQTLATRDIGDARNKALAQNYFNEQAMRSGAAGNLANLGQQGFGNQQTAYGLNRQATTDTGGQYGRQLAMGGMQQNLEQAKLGAAQQKFGEEQEAPWADLMLYNRAINPLNTGGTTTEYKGGGGLGGALGGAASGAAMGSAFGPWGTAIGAGLGGIGGMFGG